MYFPIFVLIVNISDPIYFQRLFLPFSDDVSNSDVIDG